MAGELWQGYAQVGKEATAGTSVPATRRMYWREPVLNMPRAPRIHRFATGTRDNVRGITLGPTAPEGTFILPMSADEIIEPLLASIRGGVTPTTPAGTVRLWAFTPGIPLDPWTVEWHDGANVWEGTGYHINELTIAGSVREENLITATLFGRGLVASTMTPALPQRVPTFLEGWQTRLFIDALGAVPGTTPIACTLLTWDIAIRNMMAHKYCADNTLSAGGVTFGELEIEANLMVEAATATAVAEFTNWQNSTPRLVRIEFQDETGFIETTYRRFVTIDLPGEWTAYDLGGTDEGTRAYNLTLSYTYDPTLGAGLQIRAQNARSTAY
jgi:hypothetical protein